MEAEERDGLLVVPFNTLVSIESKIVKLPSRVVEKKTSAAEDLLQNISIDDPVVAAFNTYTMIDSDHWDEFAKHIIKVNHPLSLLLRPYGVFIYGDELSKGSRSKIIGYINIFDTENFTGVLQDNDWRLATQSEMGIIQASRKNTWDSVDLQNNGITLGLIVPSKDRGAKVLNNKFKIVKVGKAAGKKTGIVCRSLDLKQIGDIMKELGLESDSREKNTLCGHIGVELLREGRVLTMPAWKPHLI
jgi:hypothetical protein